MPKTNFYTARVGRIDVTTTDWRRPRPLPQGVVKETLKKVAQSGNRVVMILRDNSFGNICIPAWVIAAKPRIAQEDSLQETQPLELKCNRACGYYDLIGRFLRAESLVSEQGSGRFREPDPYKVTTPGSPSHNIRPNLTLGEDGTCSVLSMGVFPSETFDEYTKHPTDFSNFTVVVNP